VPHPGAVTERVAGEGREGATRRRRECRGRRAGHAEAAQQARRAAEEEPGGEHGGGGGGCGGGHGGSAEARYISAAVASPAVRSGRPPCKRQPLRIRYGCPPLSTSVTPTSCPCLVGPRADRPTCQLRVSLPTSLSLERPGESIRTGHRGGEACARRSIACTSRSPAHKKVDQALHYIFQSSWIRSGSGFYWVCFTEKHEAAMMERHQGGVLTKKN
jgi:hypothetical protein